jgi:ATP-dependent phosphofructokinase / diphosphate-dependent phosphofructokinase
MQEIGHASFLRRIAINVGAGYVPGINAVVIGVATAAGKLGWETVGIRDGFDGLLSPERYPDGGLLTLDPGLVEQLDPIGGGVLGQAANVDPFHVRQVNDDGGAEETDQSDLVLQRLRAERIDAVVSVFGARGVSVLHKLHRKGLNAVCVPRSIEGDVAGTQVSFGFNSALSVTIEMLDRVRHAAKSARRIAVVEVVGQQAGWVALQAGIAACADAVLIPEIPADLTTLAGRLNDKVTERRPYGLVVVAEGATFTGEAGEHVVRTSGQVAEAVAAAVQLLVPQQTYPLVLGEWVRTGTPTAVDRQLGLLYGAGAVRALKAGNNGVMVAFVPPDIRFVPLAEAVDKVRRVPMDSEFIQIARSLGIFLGREL